VSPVAAIVRHLYHQAGKRVRSYLQFISSEYSGNWTDKLNSKSVLVAGTDVPIYRSPQSLAAKLTAPWKVRLRRRLKVGRHAATVHHCRIEDEYQAIFDNAIGDAMRYESDAKHSYYSAMSAYITKTPVQHAVIPTPKNRRAAQAGPTGRDGKQLSSVSGKGCGRWVHLRTASPSTFLRGKSYISVIGSTSASSTRTKQD
jgi:hypothetical protein